MVPVYSRLLAFLLLLICVPRSEAQALPSLGQIAPPLTVARILQAPDGSSVAWDALRGKSVVLEFWATWCGGCVENIPHINELAKRFSDRPVPFIFITDEQETTILRFLKTHPINGWVALDPKRSTFDAYKVGGIPLTFLIDAKGKLQAITQPNNLNNRVIEDLLAGKTLDVPGFDPAAGAPILGRETGAPASLSLKFSCVLLHLFK